LSEGRIGRMSIRLPSRSVAEARGIGSQASAGRAGSSLDQAAADRVADQLDPVAHAELPHRVRAMVLDRLLSGRCRGRLRSA
jgi:hypothetical protein